MTTGHIPFNKYININSGVLAGTTIPVKQLIGRFFTVNPYLPSQSYLEFSSAAAVGQYFGLTSREYLYSVFYFSFISKNLTSPPTISFARWVNISQAPSIYGETPSSLTSLQLISDGSFILTLGSATHLISALDFTGAASYTAIAAILQAAIRTFTGTQWTAATVSYNSTTTSFDFTGGNTSSPDAVSVSAGTTGTNIATSLGWFPQSVNGGPGAVWSNGSLVETITQTLTAANTLSNNYGSFIFIPPLTIEQHVEAATWNQTLGIENQYKVGTTLANYSAWSTALQPYAGVGVDLISAVLANDFTPVLSMSIMAATNYNAPNSVQNYMYQNSSLLAPLVFDLATSNALDAVFVNYIGQTQDVINFNFYQRGYLMGVGTTAPRFMNTYANEQWLRSAMGAAIMTLFLALPEIPANPTGLTYILPTMQGVINLALTNGTISVGKILTPVQITLITVLSNDSNAYLQVQNNGYWFGIKLVSVTNANNGLVEQQIQYTLIYGKDDVVLSVQGTHALV